MTQPLTPDREMQIRTLDLAPLMDDRAAATISGHLAVLLDEIDRLRNPDIADGEAPEPMQLRWGLDDVMWGDDDSVTVLLSGPDREPYWLELDQERAAVLRENLAGPPAEETHVVADDSDDPEHVNDCPGCETATPTTS